MFGVGVFSAALGIGFSYVTHYATVGIANSYILKFDHPYFSEGKSTKKWKWFKVIVHFLAFVSGLVSLGVFLFGINSVKNAINHF